LGSLAGFRWLGQIGRKEGKKDFPISTRALGEGLSYLSSWVLGEGYLQAQQEEPNTHAS